MHNEFHASQLKKPVGKALTSTDVPSQITEVTTAKEPETILDRLIVKRRGQAVTKVLLKWKKHQIQEDATWEFYYDIGRKFPSFHS